MKKLSLIIAFCFLLFGNNTTKAQYREYNHNGIKLGYNIGGAWQQSDVKSKWGLGQGFTLGVTVYQKQNAFFSFDLRGRYLNAESYGFDLKRTSLSLADSSDVHSKLGYNGTSDSSYFRNHKTSFVSGSLEGVLYFNRLREKTRILLYGFGGLGVAGYNTSFDQLDNSGNLYDYGRINTTKNDQTIARDLKTLRGINNAWNADYETQADGYTKNEYVVNFVPTLGFGLGYQLTPRIAIGFEHLISFPFREDNLDGFIEQSAGAKIKNDRLHYTALTLNWRFFGQRYYDGRILKQDTVRTNTQVQTPKFTPTIRFVNPSSPRETTTEMSYVVRAVIDNVTKSSEIGFFVNGVNTTQFFFDGRELTYNAILNQGVNIFKIVAANADGSDSKETSVIYQLPNINTSLPPVINFINPSNTSTDVSNSTFDLKAEIKNVSKKENVQLFLNNKEITAFSFNSSNGLLEYTLLLNENRNTIEIKASNSKGATSGSRYLTLTRNNRLQKPTISITNPVSNPYNSNDLNENVSALISNVSSSSSITLTINGIRSSQFTFNPDSKRFSTNFQNNKGRNSVIIEARNEAGSATETVIINYTEKVPIAAKPTVKITLPSTNPYTVTTQLQKVTAKIENLGLNGNILNLVNGQSNPSFNYNANTGIFETNIMVAEGKTEIEIIASNSIGNANDKVTIYYNYKDPTSVPEPEVTITTPNSKNTVSSTSVVNIQAEIKHVVSSTKVIYKVNNVVNSNFNFIASTNKFTATANLLEGPNRIEIIGSNERGVATDFVIIDYKKASVLPKPIVTVTNPTSSPFVSNNKNFDYVAQVQNVSSNSDITLNMNGATKTFGFDANTGKVTASLALKDGNNTILIIAKNSSGSASATTILSYTAPQTLPQPVVQITNPSSSPFVSTSSQTKMEATVLNVSDKNGIQVTLNNNSILFNYDASANKVTADLSLVTGSNTVKVSATNASGNSADQKEIKYEVKSNPTIPAPTVVISTPAKDNYLSSDASFTAEAKVSNVQSDKDITVELNGKKLSNFTLIKLYMSVTMPLTLQNGDNVLKVTVETAGGMATDTRIIKHQVVLPMPIITVQNPSSSNTTVTNEIYSYRAKVENVNSANDIVIKQNNVILGGHLYDSDSKVATISLGLKNGDNTIEIRATNSVGTSTKTNAIKYVGNLAPPVIVLINPNGPVGSSTGSAYKVLASISNIYNRNDITFKLGNSTINTFVFNTTTGDFSCDINLPLGYSNIELSATNSVGSDTKSAQILNDRPNNTLLPAVSIIRPFTNNLTVNSDTFNFVANVLNVGTKSAITIKLNGSNVSFNFNSVTHEANFIANLVSGANNITVTATNEDGFNSATAIINYQAASPGQRIAKPSIQMPTTESSNTTNYSFSGNVSNVSAKSQIVLKVNNVATNFDYNANTGQITSNLNLRNGNNAITVDANYTGGTETKTMNIVVSLPQAPNVRITRPNATSTVIKNINFEAKTESVTSKQNIELYLNNLRVNDFTFNPTTETISARMELNAGTNEIRVTVKNETGNKSTSFAITYNAPTNSTPINKTNTNEEGGKENNSTSTAPAVIKKPSIRLNSPSNLTVTTETLRMDFTVENVSQSSDITVALNGKNISFTFDAKTGKLTFTVAIDKAKEANLVRVIAKNAGGSASKISAIIYQAPSGNTNTPAKGSGQE